MKCYMQFNKGVKFATKFIGRVLFGIDKTLFGKNYHCKTLIFCISIVEYFRLSQKLPIVAFRFNKS